MEFLATVKAMIPDWAKDIRLNLDGTIARSSLKPEAAVGVALAAAYAARSPGLIGAFKGGLSPEDVNISEEHTSELQSLMRISYAVFCFKKTKDTPGRTQENDTVRNPILNTQ